MFEKKKKEKVREPIRRITINKAKNGWSVEVVRDFLDEDVYVFKTMEDVLSFLTNESHQI